VGKGTCGSLLPVVLLSALVFGSPLSGGATQNTLLSICYLCVLVAGRSPSTHLVIYPRTPGRPPMKTTNLTQLRTANSQACPFDTIYPHCWRARSVTYVRAWHRPNLSLLCTMPHLQSCTDDGLRHRVSAATATSPADVSAAEQVTGTNNKFTWQVR